MNSNQGSDTNMPISKIITGVREPLYRQLARELERRIATGKLNSGDGPASYRALCEEFGVSMSVVQRAFRELRRDDLVRTQQGRRVELAPDARAEKVIHKYGFIHPYSDDNAFGRLMPYLAGRAFEGMGLNSFVLVRSSGGDSGREREIAENMLHNGIQGLLLSPADIRLNGPFFEEAARHIPVVQLDQTLERAQLPGILFDYRRAGREIAGYLFRKCNTGRLLAVLDEKVNQSIRELTDGMIEAARESGRADSMEIIALPVVRMFADREKPDCRLQKQLAGFLEEKLVSGNFDTLFFPFTILVEYIMVASGVHARHPQIRLGTMNYTRIEQHSAAYFQARIMEWEQDYHRLFTEAARLLLRWEQSGQRPTLRKRLRIGRRFRLAAGNAEPAAPLNAFALYPGKTENGSINAIPQTLRKEKER